MGTNIFLQLSFPPGFAHCSWCYYQINYFDFRFAQSFVEHINVNRNRLEITTFGTSAAESPAYIIVKNIADNMSEG